MGITTGIEWCDHTFNPWIGCTKVAPGCANCYAEVYGDRFGVGWGPNGSRRRTSDNYWRLPLLWNHKAAAAGERRRVFCASLADVFEIWDGPVLDHRGGKLYRGINSWLLRTECEGRAPASSVSLTLAHLRGDLFKLIDATPMLDWLLLTKRPENIPRMWPAGDYRRNVWLGTSVSEQKSANENIEQLLKCRDFCSVLFLSVEPLLGSCDLGLRNWSDADSEGPKINWVIVGGESGPEARPCNLADVRLIVEDCALAGVPCFVKQLGKRPFEPAAHSKTIDSWVGLNDRKKGGDISEWPKDLRIRQFPEVKHAHSASA